MKIELSEDEMLTVWREARGLNTALDYNGVIERNDGIDADSFLKYQIRGWYADLLAHGPAEALACTNLAMALTPCGELCWEAEVPATAVRIFDVHVSGCGATIPIIDAFDGSVNPFMPPVAVVRGSRLAVMPFEAKPDVLRATVVLRPSDGSFVFDECALKMIFPFIPEVL